MYKDLLQLLFPLCLTLIAVDIGEQAVNLTITRSSDGEDSADMLAAYTSAFFIVKFSVAFLVIFRPINLVLVESPHDYYLCRRMFLFGCATLFTFCLVCALTPLGRILTGISETILVRKSFLALSGVPILDGFGYYLEGLLLRRRLSNWVAASSICGICLQVVTVVVELGSGVSSSHILALAVIPIYVGRVTTCIVSLAGLNLNSNFLQKLNEKHSIRELAIRSSSTSVSIHNTDLMTSQESVVFDAYDLNDGPLTPKLKEHQGDSNDAESSFHSSSPWSPSFSDRTQDVYIPLNMRTVFKFAWPLVLTALSQRISRPIILSVVSYKYGEDDVAVLGLVYPLGHIFYGWLNSLKAAEPAFQDQVARRRHYVPRLAAIAVLCSVSGALLTTLSGGSKALLVHFMEVSDEIAAKAEKALLIFSFFGIAVGIRGVLMGRATVEKRTKALMGGGPTRIVVILLVLLLLPIIFGEALEGATLGIIALFSGFVSETIALFVGMVATSGRAKHYAQVVGRGGSVIQSLQLSSLPNSNNKSTPDIGCFDHHIGDEYSYDDDDLEIDLDNLDLDDSLSSNSGFAADRDEFAAYAKAQSRQLQIARESARAAAAAVRNTSLQGSPGISDSNSQQYRGSIAVENDRITSAPKLQVTSNVIINVHQGYFDEDYMVDSKPNNEFRASSQQPAPGAVYALGIDDFEDDLSFSDDEI